MPNVQLASVASPTIKAEAVLLDTKGYSSQLLDRDPDQIGLRIWRADGEDRSATIHYSWNAPGGEFHEYVSVSDTDFDRNPRRFKSLTPEIVRRGVGLALSELTKARGSR